jgi:hypothetical protein
MWARLAGLGRGWILAWCGGGFVITGARVEPKRNAYVVGERSFVHAFGVQSRPTGGMAGERAASSTNLH